MSYDLRIKCGGSGVTLDVDDDTSTLRIVTISLTTDLKGDAVLTLEKICLLSDLLQYSVTARVNPILEAGIAEFYRRFGFESVSGLDFVRQPRERGAL